MLNLNDRDDFRSSQGGHMVRETLFLPLTNGDGIFASVTRDHKHAEMQRILQKRLGVHTRAISTEAVPLGSGVLATRPSRPSTISQRYRAKVGSRKAT